MARATLTDRFVASRKPATRKAEWIDKEVAGLGLVVYPDGTKAFTQRVKVGSERARITLGHHRSTHSGGVVCQSCMSVIEAREAALNTKAMVNRGEDPRPREQEEMQGNSFEAVATRCMAWRIDNKAESTTREEQRMLKTDILRATVEGRPFGELPIDEITPDQVEAVILPVLTRGGYQANRVRALLSIVFRWAIRKERLVRLNPVAAVEQMHKEEPRTRVLSDAEIVDFWRTLDKKRDRHQPDIPYYFKLALLTLARRKELRLMEWDRIRDGVWEVPLQVELPNGKTISVIKNRVPHRLPLSPLALKLLDELKPITGHGRWVFPSPQDRTLPRVNPQRARETYRKAADVAPFQLRDLRATGATLLAAGGVEERVIAMIQNHLPRGVTAKHYIRDKIRQEPLMLRALTYLSNHVEQLLDRESGDPGGDILPFVTRLR